MLTRMLHCERGFTLIEVMSSLLILSFVMLLILSMIGYSFDEVRDDVKRVNFSSAQREFEAVLVNELRSSPDVRLTYVDAEYVLRFEDRSGSFVYVRLNGVDVSLSRDGVDYIKLFDIDESSGSSIVIENRYLEIKYKSSEGVDYRLGYYLEDARIG